ncbi:unnamed protein product [Parajaminaea phylloscopi]
MASQVTFPKKEEEERPPSFPSLEPLETPKEKLIRKLKQEPLVPIGSLLTIGALTVASHYLRTGNRASFNRALRWRIYFQGLTVVAAIGGVYYYGSGQAATPPAPAGDSSSSSASGSSASAYSSIATTPGRPPTNHQVAKAEDRDRKTRAEWEERFRTAQQQQDERAEQKALEEALLKGTGMSLNAADRDAVGAGSLARPKVCEGEAADGARASESSTTPSKPRPVIGQDRRDRRAD